MQKPLVRHDAKGRKAESEIVALATPRARAVAIMGREHVLGPEIVSDLYGVTSLAEETITFDLVPFSEATLRNCMATHLLVAGYPLTIEGIQSRVSRFLFSQQFRALPGLYLREQVPLQWFLLRKSIIKSSANRYFAQQTSLLESREELPRACEFTYAVILYYLATGTKLFASHGVRCANPINIDYVSPNSGRTWKGHVVCGGFDTDGFRICMDIADGHWFPSIGVTGIRRIQ